MYRMVISEFDKVLINSEEAISQNSIISIDNIRKKNVLFCIMTDRGVGDIISYNRDFPFIDYIIAYNGAVIYDVSRSKVIYSKSIPKIIVSNITSKFSDYNILAFYKDRVDVIDTTSDIYQLCIECKSNKNARSILDEINKLELNISAYIREYNGKYSVLITSKSKDFAIKKLSKESKIPLKDIAYIGTDKDKNDFTDLGLFTTANGGIGKLLDKIFK